MQIFSHVAPKFPLSYTLTNYRYVAELKEAMQSPVMPPWTQIGSMLAMESGSFPPIAIRTRAHGCHVLSSRAVPAFSDEVTCI